MRNQFLFLIFTFFLSLSASAQITFEKGYYLDNSGEKVEGYIKNPGWKNSPEVIDFKASENSKVRTLHMNEIQEFGFGDILYFIRRTVAIDRTGDNWNTVSSIKNPVFKKEKLFLKVLVHGSANLYSYQDGQLIRYFFDSENIALQQLIFKRYKISNNVNGENNGFRNQLSRYLIFDGYTLNDIQKLNYYRNDLVKYFIAYNNSQDSTYNNIIARSRQGEFNLNLKPRIRISDFIIENNSNEKLDSENKLSFGLGLEAEYILPFHKNKWSLFIEPTYQYFKSESIPDPDKIAALRSSLNYNSLEIPLGLRYYSFLNDRSKLFFHGALVMDLPFNSNLRISRSSDEAIGNMLQIRSGANLAIGLGYNYADAFSLEIRYQTARELLTEYVLYTSEYNTISMILGYTLF